MDLTLHNNYDEMFDNIVTETTKYIVDHKLEAMVFGASGGIDSALTAALARFICIRAYVRYKHKCRLIGMVLPANSNKAEETWRGAEIARLFCDMYTIRNIERLSAKLYQEMQKDVWMCYDTPQSEEDGRIAYGNVKARVRMIKLMDMARRLHGIVLSTDNLTELMLGFWTLHGDVGNYGMIQNIWKTEVYGLSNWIINSDQYDLPKKPMVACIEAVPTDGLGVSNSDFDQLGVDSYREIDNRLIELLAAPKGSRLNLADPIIKRHLRTEFKRRDPISIPRMKVLGKE